LFGKNGVFFTNPNVSIIPPRVFLTKTSIIPLQPGFDALAKILHIKVAFGFKFIGIKFTHCSILISGSN